MAYYNLLNLFLELKNKIKCQIEATANQDNLTREIKKQNNQEMEFNFWENGIVKEERWEDSSIAKLETLILDPSLSF